MCPGIMEEQEVDGRASIKGRWRKHSSGRDMAYIRVRVGEDERVEIYTVQLEPGLADLVPRGEYRTQSKTYPRHRVVLLVNYDYTTIANFHK
jgi:hypothetical protein